jgi:hypothetical protein
MAFTQTDGILNQLPNNAAGGSLVQLYSPPTNANASFSITCCNRSTTTSAQVTIVAQVGSTQSNLENLVSLAPAGNPGSSFTLRAVVLGPNQAILVQNTQAAVDFTAIGYTEPANVEVI